MDTNWNAGFTQLLRDTHPSYWGNWTLDANIAPGAVGVLDTGTGSLRFLANLPNVKATDAPTTANDWTIQSSTVHQTTASIDLGGKFTDPDTGTKITAGLETTWSFSEAGSISSTFTLAKQTSLDDFAKQIMANKDWLVSEAASVGMSNNGEISQGFGVITNVLYASCGLNLGAQTASSTFSISGSVDATNAMSGAGDANAKGSYAETNKSAAFESHLWPSASSKLAANPVPIAFEFACFVGDAVIPGWITNVSGLNIQLDNAHGGTYIVDATAKYSEAGSSKTVSGSVSGGLTKTLDPIPVDATDLEIDLSFEGMFSDEKHKFTWPSPLTVFPTGQIIIDLNGVWPGSTSAKERATGTVG